MASNSYVNKVEFGNQTIMDLTNDTVEPNDVIQGKTFHDKSGTPQIGTYEAPTITDITPSNTSPVSLVANGQYRTISAGKAVASVTNLAPSNASPATIAANTIYKGTAAGKAVASVTSATPSDTSPPALASGTVYKPSAAGYLFSSKNLFKRGTFTSTLNTSQSINMGFKPKYLAIRWANKGMWIYDSSYNSTTYLRATANILANGTIGGSGGDGQFVSLNTNGITIKPSSSDFVGTAYYFAIG